MLLRWFLAELRTGRNLMDLAVLSSSKWGRSLNKPETLTADVDMQDPSNIALNMRQAATPGRVMLGVAVDDVILAAGPVWARSYATDTRQLTLTATGIWSYFDHRFVLPVAAATADVSQFTIPDTSAAGKTKPNPALGTYLTGLELGTIAKRWVQQARAWTGGSVPIVFEDDRTGTGERNLEGAEFKNVGTVLKQLTEVQGGPDIRFMPRFTADRLGVEFLLQTGTDANPLLAGGPHLWNLSAPLSGVSKMDVSEDASDLASTAWATAGRSSDNVLVARSMDSTLLDLGYPMLEALDSSHSSVSEQATLDGYAREATTGGQKAAESWKLTVEADAQPMLGAYWEGDYCTVDIAPYDPVAGTGDPYLIEGGKIDRRITGFSGNADGLTVEVTTQEVV